MPTLKQASGKTTEIGDAPTAPSLRWKTFLPSTPARYRLLVAHGLNLNPAKMDPLCYAAAAAGAVVVRVALTGHRGARREMFDANRTVWLQDMREAYAELTKISRETPGSTHFLGFSLGALLGADLMANDQTVSFQKSVLIAPALALRPYAAVLRCLRALPFTALPNPDPGGYNANRFVTSAAYRGLFDSLDAFRSSSTVLATDALVLIDPHDKVISAAYLRSTAASKRFQRYRVEQVRSDQPRRSVPRHLMIDEDSAGPALWQAMLAMILEHLDPVSADHQGRSMP